MKKLTLLILLLPFAATAQTDTIPTADSATISEIEWTDDVPEPVTDDTDIFEIYGVEKVAEFEGGQPALQKFVRNNLVYPDSARNNDIGGTVLVEFVIDTSGNVTNIKTLGKPHGYLLEEAAIAVVEMTSGKWSPATQRDHKVKMKMRMPFKFSLY